MKHTDEILLHWNKKWVDLFKKFRLSLIYDVPKNILSFLENSKIVFKKDDEKSVGDIVYFEYKGKVYRLRKFTMPTFNTAVYYIKCGAGEMQLANFFDLNIKAQSRTRAFLDNFPFEEVCQELNRSFLNVQAEQLKKELGGVMIADVIHEDGEFYLLLSNSNKIAIKKSAF